MPLQATSGAATYDAYGGGAAAVPNYIEDVFSTWLYTGTGAALTINNGVDLAGKGGMVWIKDRTTAYNNCVMDSVRGTTNGNILYTNTSDANQTSPTIGISSYNSNGFTLRNDADGYGTNIANDNFVSWTFAQQAKFFDVVTYTGNGTTQNISHLLGSVPGMIIVKKLSNVGNWPTWHRSLDFGKILNLNLTTDGTSGPFPTYFGNNTTAVDPTSTQFTVGSNANVNESGDTYVAYLFAHNAGGFGLTGTDNVISCGSYTGNGSSTGPVITLGYEPQWVMVKRSSAGIEDWEIYDNMRGIVPAGADRILYPNKSSQEQSATRIQISATGFSPDGTAGSVNANGATYIYMAIRRGPMKVPTTGTSVYYPFARAGNDTQTDITGVGFTPDLWLVKTRNINAAFPWFDRLRGVTRRVDSTSTTQEETFSGSNGLVSLNMDGITIGAGALDGGICNDTGADYGNWLFKRAPGFFDEVCYTGTGSATTQAHNLGAVPELIICKRRNIANDWPVYSASTGASSEILLNDTVAATGSSVWNSTAPTSSVFSIGTANNINASGGTYVAYLFATVAGVSKVGSYSGTGATQTIDCGFTGGARFVMIKRTNSTGAWYVWDTARGMSSGTDPSLRFNAIQAEVNANSVFTVSTGFQIVSTDAEINASGGNYIFLAIA